jgi:hypothetical protein
MQNNIAFSILCLFLLSCSNDDIETDPFMDIQNIPLIWKEYYSNELSHEYSYTEDKLPNESKSKWSYTAYTYNKDHQLVSYDMYDDMGLASSDWETAQQYMNRTEWVTPENTAINGTVNYIYAKNKLTKIEVTRLPSGTKSYTTYEYDTNGRISKRVYYYENQASSYNEFFYDESGNLVTEIKKDIIDGTPVMSVKTEYEFDDKNNPYIAFQRLLRPGEYSNKNNIIKKVQTLYFDAPLAEKIQETNNTYEYNSEGYPIKKNNKYTFEYLPAR